MLYKLGKGHYAWHKPTQQPIIRASYNTSLFGWRPAGPLRILTDAVDASIQRFNDAVPRALWRKHIDEKIDHQVHALVQKHTGKCCIRQPRHRWTPETLQIATHVLLPGIIRELTTALELDPKEDSIRPGQLDAT